MSRKDSLLIELRVTSFQPQDFVCWAKVFPPGELFLMEVHCAAGTYVKELVHGDLGRTSPSLASLTDCPMDLLALDVVAIEHPWPTSLTVETAN